jgi:hypothetical protein
MLSLRSDPRSQGLNIKIEIGLHLILFDVQCVETVLRKNNIVIFEVSCFPRYLLNLINIYYLLDLSIPNVIFLSKMNLFKNLFKFCLSAKHTYL